MLERVNRIKDFQKKISLIIPALNEAAVIGETLRAIGRPPKCEIIVVDGGSRDGTVAIAGGYADKVLSAPSGRGGQMNEGARAAQGEILLFLHADTKLPEGWAPMVREALADESVVGGAFRFSIDDPSPLCALISFGANLRSCFLRLPYGDQAIFVRQDIFERIGGYPYQPIMEDVEMVRAIGREGKLIILGAAVKTSARRWRKEGPFRVTIRNQLLLILYLLGVSPSRLHRFYRAIR